MVSLETKNNGLVKGLILFVLACSFLVLAIFPITLKILEKQDLKEKALLDLNNAQFEEQLERYGLGYKNGRDELYNALISELSKEENKDGVMLGELKVKIVKEEVGEGIGGVEK